MYKLRKSLPKRKGQIIKLLMNSLYGKFGETRINKETTSCKREEFDSYMEDGWQVVAVYEDDYIIQRVTGRVVPKHSNVIISTMITALARDYLYNNLKKVPFEDLVYTDTDSIIFQGNHIDKFEVGDELGQWKIETNKFTGEELKGVEGLFYGEKKYDIDGLIKLAGNNNPNITHEHLKGEATFKNKKMYTYNMALRTGNFDKIGTMWEEEKKVNPNFRKRLAKFPMKYVEPYKDDLIGHDGEMI